MPKFKSPNDEKAKIWEKVAAGRKLIYISPVWRSGPEPKIFFKNL
jgi:hypothetical protein